MKSAKVDAFEEYDPVCSSIDTIFETVQDHFQKSDFPVECVTISKNSPSRRPVSLNFEFINEKGDWKVNFIHNVYQEPENAQRNR